jgi:hypothetical protein
VCLNVKNGSNVVPVIFEYCLGSCFKSELNSDLECRESWFLYSLYCLWAFQQYMVAHAIC